MAITVLRTVVFVCIFLPILFLSCSTPPERVPYILPAQHQVSSWDEVFQHPLDIRVEQWDTARFPVPVKGIMNMDYPGAPPMERKMVLPAIVLYVQMPDGRNVLIDSGMERGYGEHPYGHASGPGKFFILGKGTQNKGQSLIERLEERELTVDTVLLTHMHYDHIGGLSDLPGDSNILVGEGAEPLDFPLFFTTDYLDHIESLKEISFEDAYPLWPFDAVVDLFGDGSIFAVSTPGHTPGHVSYLINSSDGPYFVSGDQVNIPENLEYNIPPGYYSSDMELAEGYFMQIREFLNAYPQVKLLMGHSIEGRENLQYSCSLPGGE